MIHTFQGLSPRLGQRVFVAPTATVLGDVTVGDDTSIWFNCVIRGDVHWIRIGAGCNIQDMCCLHVTTNQHPLLMEDHVSVGHNVLLHGCTIRRGALIGMSSTIMDGAEIGEGCLVAAGSLVREGFTAPPHTLVAGWPAVVKRDLTPAQQALAGGLWQRYIGHKDDYLAEGWGGPVGAEMARLPDFSREPSSR